MNYQNELLRLATSVNHLEAKVANLEIRPIEKAVLKAIGVSDGTEASIKAWADKNGYAPGRNGKAFWTAYEALVADEECVHVVGDKALLTPHGKRQVE